MEFKSKDKFEITEARKTRTIVMTSNYKVINKSC